MNYIDANGRLYEVCFNCSNLMQVTVTDHGRRTKFAGVTGSKTEEVVQQRLDAYASEHGLVAYPNVVCADCMQRIGKVWPPGHIAAFYPAVCDACGQPVTCTEIRDWGHLHTVDEFKAFYRVAKGLPAISVSEIMENTKLYIGG